MTVKKLLLLACLLLVFTVAWSQGSRVQQCTDRFANEPALKEYEKSAAKDIVASYQGVFVMFGLAYKYCHCHASSEELQALKDGLMQNAREIKNLNRSLPYIPENVLYKDSCEPKENSEVLAVADGN